LKLSAREGVINVTSFMVKEEKVLGRFRWEIEEEKVVLVMGVLYLTLMLGSVGVRKGGRRHVTPSNTHVLKVGREKVYDRQAWLI
jgi:hypothetical protein